MTKSIKRIVLFLCSALCLASVGVAVAVMPKTTVQAAEATASATTSYGLSLNKSVSLRIAGSGGVRFSGSIETAQIANVSEYGIVLADEVTYYKNGDLTMAEGMYNRVANNKNGTMKITEAGDKTNFSVALYGIKENNIARSYAARGYVLADGTYYYTDVVTANPYELAKGAYTENGLTENDIVNDYLQRVVDVNLDENNTVSVNSPLAGLSTTTDTIAYDADQTLGWSGIDKKVAALYVNGNKVAAAYTGLALSDWGTLSVTMSGADVETGTASTYNAFLTVNGASFENGQVTFDVSSVLPEMNVEWLSGLSGASSVKYIQSAYSANAKSVSISGTTNISLPVTDYDAQLRNYGANYLRIRMAFTAAGQTLKVNGLNNDQEITIKAGAVGENILLTVNKSNELFALYTNTGESVHLGNLKQDVFFGRTALSLTVNGGSSFEISPLFMSVSDEFNSAGDAILEGADLSVETGSVAAPEGTFTFSKADSVFTQSIGVGWQGYIQSIKKTGESTATTWRYWQVLLGGYKYTDYSSVTFYVSGNYASYKYSNVDGQPLFTSKGGDNGMTKITIKNDGTVFADGVQCENKMNTDGAIKFHVETGASHNSATAYYGEFHVSDFIVLGDRVSTVGKIEASNISIRGIDAIGNETTTHANANINLIPSKDNRINFSGEYSAQIQAIVVGDTQPAHRNFKLTVNRDYRNYDSFSFYLSTNSKLNWGSIVFSVGGKLIGSVVVNESTKVTVMNDGLVYVNDMPTGAYMQNGEIALYICNNRAADAYYGEIHVARLATVNGVIDTLFASELSLVGVDGETTYAANLYWSQGNNADITSAIKTDLQQIKKDGTNTYWKYFRANLIGLNYANYDSVSFTIGNPRGMKFFVEDTEVADFYNVSASVIKHTFTVYTDGSLYVDGADTGVDYVGNEIYFDIVTSHPSHGLTSGSAYFASFNIDPTIVLEGGTNIALTTGNVGYYVNLVGTEEPVIEEEEGSAYETPKTDTEYPTDAVTQAGWHNAGATITEKTSTWTYNQTMLKLNLPKVTYGGQSVGWRYYRMNLGFDFRSYDKTTFYLVNWNGRDVTTNVYLQDGTLLTSLFPKPQKETKFTIDREGFVFIDDNPVAAGQIKTEKPIFYLDTQNPYYNDPNDYYWGNMFVSYVTQDGTTKTFTHENFSNVYPLQGVDVSSFPVASFNKNVVSTASFSASGSEKLAYNGGAEMATHTAGAAGSSAEDSYYRATFNYMGLNYLANDSTEFYVGFNVGNVEFYMNGVKLGKTAAHTALKIKIDKQGLVFVNDSTSCVTKVNGTFAVEALVPKGSSPYAVFKTTQNVWVNGTAQSLAAGRVSLAKISALSVPVLTSSAAAVETEPVQVATWETRTDAPGIGNGYWIDLDQKSAGGTATGWSYYRFAMEVDYKLYETVSFYLSARITNFDLYMYQTKIATIPANTAVKITVDRAGNVYIGDNLTEAVGTFTGENIVFDLDIHHTEHGVVKDNFIGIRLSVSDVITTSTGTVPLSTNLLSVAAVAKDVVIAPEVVENTYTVVTGTFGAATVIIPAVNKDIAMDGYTVTFGTVNGEAWKIYELAVNANPASYDSVTLHLNATSNVDVYANNKCVGTLSANVWTDVTVYKNGSVAFDGTLVEGVSLSDTILRLKLDTKGESAVTLTTLAFASANGGQEKIDLNDNLAIMPASMSAILHSEWTVEGTNWAYNYQEVGSVDLAARVPVTVGYGYTQYSKVAFTLTSNMSGVSVYASKKEGATALYSFTANVPVEFTVDGEGFVYVAGEKKGRLTTSTTTLYIGIDEELATDYDYYTILVGKTVSLAGSYSVVGDNEIGVGVTEDVLIDNGTSEYVILKGASDEYINFAAEEVQSVLEGATGVKLPIATMLTEQTKDNKYILIGGNGVPTSNLHFENALDASTTENVATEEEKKLMGVTKTYTYQFPDSWSRIKIKYTDLTAHDEWIFYAKHDLYDADKGKENKELMLADTGGNYDTDSVVHIEAEGWQEFRLIRNPAGSFGNDTYNVYYNGVLRLHPDGNTVELDGNDSSQALWWTSGGDAKLTHSGLFYVEKTPVESAESMLLGAGEGGYALKTENGNIHVFSNTTFGGMTGALDMLGYMVNYEAYANDSVYYDTGITTLPVHAFDHTFTPLIDERHVSYQAVTNSDENRYRLKLQEQMDEWGAWIHTTVSQFLPVGTYGSHYSTSLSSNGISNVTLDSAKLANKVGMPSANTTYTFEYKKWLFSNYWYYGSTRGINLADYGITITGTPSQGDKITVSYSTEAAGHTDWYNDAGNQICYGTALEDTTSADGMYQTFLTNVQGQILNYFSTSERANRDSIFLALGHEDNNSYCDCSKCLAIMNNYGGATGGGYAAMQLQFASKISEDVKAWLPSVKLGHKEIKFAILAYGTAGRVVPTANVAGIDENVYVMVAPIESFYNVDIYDEANSSVYERVTGWANYMANNDREGGVIVYNYALNGLCYMFPTNLVAAGSFYDTFAANDISYVYTQGVANAKTASFEQLRIYLESKLMYDTKYSREELIKDFIMHYYDDAENPTGSGEIMLKVYNELENYYAYLSRTTYDMYKDGTGAAEENGNGFNGYWHCDLFGPMDTSRSTGTAPTYWSTARLKNMISQISQAIAAINASSLDQTTKDQLIYRVDRENIFPMFVSIAMSYANYHDANDLNNSGTKDAFYDFDAKLTAEEKQSYITYLKTLTKGCGMTNIYEASSLLWRNGLGIATNDISEYLTTLEGTGSKWYTKAD